MPQVYDKLLSKGVMQSILFANTEAGGTKVLGNKSLELK